MSHSNDVDKRKIKFSVTFSFNFQFIAYIQQLTRKSA